MLRFSAVISTVLCFIHFLTVEKASFLSQPRVLTENSYVEILLVQSAFLGYLGILEVEQSFFC